MLPEHRSNDSSSRERHDGISTIEEESNPGMEERHQRYSVRRAYASIQIALGITPKRLEKDMRHASMQTAQDL